MVAKASVEQVLAMCCHRRAWDSQEVVSMSMSMSRQMMDRHSWIEGSRHDAG